MFKNILKFLTRHKVIAGIAAILIVVGGYYGYKAIFVKAVPPRYVLAAVEKGTLISSVSGSGQISVLSQVDLKSKVSGDVTYVAAVNGQEVKSGAFLAQIDSSDAQRSVRDAQTALDTAKLDLAETLKPVDELTLLQAEDALTQAQESKKSSEDDLAKAREDGFNAIVSSFFDLPAIMTDLDGILHNSDINKSQENIAAYADMVNAYNEIAAVQYKNTAVASFNDAHAKYDTNFQTYKTVNRSSDAATVEALINQTYDTAKKIAEAFKNADNLISFVSDTLTAHGLVINKTAVTHQTTIRTDTTKVNSIISNLLSIRQTIQNDNAAIIKADRTIQEKGISLQNTKAGADELTIRGKQISVQQKEDALVTAKENLADYYIRAPFDGVVAKVNVKKGDSISGGAAIATIITKQRIAEISLNEVDVAKVKNGQKVTLTFDAIEGLSIAGEVADVDAIGTVSQGVVTYNVKIIFDTQDDRVKPGMSVSTAIITDIKQNVLLVPNSAVKTQGTASYVEVVANVSDPTAATQPTGVVLSSPTSYTAVEVGISNDTSAEIVSGLKEGDYVVSRTVSQSAVKTNSKSSGAGMMMGGFGR